MAKTLDWFQKHEGSDVVVISFLKNDADVGLVRGEIRGSDAALMAHAGGEPWDEDTICAVYGLVRKPA